MPTATASRAATAPLLLTAEQMRQFLADGYIVLQPTVPAGLHETIRARLAGAIVGDDNPGNNVLPLVPELRHVLRSPEVHGALISLLGADYLEHPHRFCHVEEHPEDPDIDRAAKLAANSHQDSYTPLARPRHHHVRYARVMYYPQDTPIELGPTHVIPGTQLNIGLSDAECARPLPVSGAAGTVSITHFDIGHAAGINLRDERRYMVKFIFTRSAAPQPGPWSGAEHRWRTPAELTAVEPTPLAWSHMWDWLRGAPDRYASLDADSGASAHSAGGRGTDDAQDGSRLTDDVQDVQRLIGDLDQGRDTATRVAAAEALARHRTQAAAAVPALVAALNAFPDPVRIAATYALGAIGEPAVAALTASLSGSGAALAVLRDRMERDDRRGRRWRERSLVMDDAAHALAAIGAPAVPALLELLRADDEWARLNAAFALGELDRAGSAAAAELIAALDDPSHLVVRTAADSLGQIGATQAAAALGALFHAARPGWDEEASRGWCPRDQVRVNAATALARLGAGAAAAEADLVHALDDPCGQVATFALEALRRIGSPTALDAALRLLTAERWDPSVTSDNRF